MLDREPSRPPIKVVRAAVGQIAVEVDRRSEASVLWSRYECFADELGDVSFDLYAVVCQADIRSPLFCLYGCKDVISLVITDSSEAAR